jgi:hypothetical protein
VCIVKHLVAADLLHLGNTNNDTVATSTNIINSNCSTISNNISSSGSNNSSDSNNSSGSNNSSSSGSGSSSTSGSGSSSSSGSDSTSGAGSREDRQKVCSERGIRRGVTTYVELGAGNGLLGLAVTTALSSEVPATTAATSGADSDSDKDAADGHESGTKREATGRVQLVMVERAGILLVKSF